MKLGGSPALHPEWFVPLLQSHTSSTDPGSVLVVAQERLATDRFDVIVTRKDKWIVSRLRRAAGYGPPSAPREFVNGESMLEKAR